MQGVPGMGKDFFIDNFRKEMQLSTEEMVVCSADDHFMKNGHYDWNPAQLATAHGSCFKKFVAALDSFTPYVFVNNTNIMKVQWKQYTYFAEKRGYNVEFVNLFEEFDLSTSLKRDELCRKFAERNVHSVPMASIERMMAQYLKEN